MIGEPRTIARIVELLHIPYQPVPETLRDVYLQIARSCGYDNFIRIGPGARMETLGEGGSASRVQFGNDRITFHEEHTGASLESLLRRVEEVVRVAFERLAIPVIICRNITLRAVAGAPRNLTAAQFLADNLLHITGQDFAPFGRPGQIVGMRMQFPPTDPQQGVHQVRIESYLRDARALYLEDWATFKVPIPTQDLECIARELREVETFLHERIAAFLNQFPRT